jgi:excinuclease UvrABC helicase subunit UvrB
LLHELVTALYSRKDAEPGRGNFRVRGDVVEVYLAYADEGVRVHFWGDEIETHWSASTPSSRVMEAPSEITIYPANIFVTSRETLNGAIHAIQEDMVKQVDLLQGDRQAPGSQTPRRTGELRPRDDARIGLLLRASRTTAAISTGARPGSDRSAYWTISRRTS